MHADRIDSVDFIYIVTLDVLLALQKHCETWDKYVSKPVVEEGTNMYQNLVLPE
jgi:hypothetical protein